MGRYNYPPDWRSLSPLARDDFHRRMGAYLRRVRFLGHMLTRDPARWRWRWWDGTRWREHGETEAELGEDQAPLCPSCGYRMEWQECEGYGCDDGQVSVYDDDPLWYDEDDTEPCQICEGAGGWWRCVNTPAWCAANPVSKEG